MQLYIPYEKVNTDLANTILPNAFNLHPDYDEQLDAKMQICLPGYQGITPKSLAGFDWHEVLGFGYGLTHPLNYVEVNPHHGANIITFALSYGENPKTNILLCSPKKEKCEHDISPEVTCPSCSDEILKSNTEQIFRLLDNKTVFYTRHSLEEIDAILSNINLVYINDMDLSQEEVQAWMQMLWQKLYPGGVMIVNDSTNVELPSGQLCLPQVKQTRHYNHQIFILKEGT